MARAELPAAEMAGTGIAGAEMTAVGDAEGGGGQVWGWRGRSPSWRGKSLKLFGLRILAGGDRSGRSPFGLWPSRREGRRDRRSLQTSAHSASFILERVLEEIIRKAFLAPTKGYTVKRMQGQVSLYRQKHSKSFSCVRHKLIE